MLPTYGISDVNTRIASLYHIHQHFVHTCNQLRDIYQSSLSLSPSPSPSTTPPSSSSNQHHHHHHQQQQENKHRNITTDIILSQL